MTPRLGSEAEDHLRRRALERRSSRAYLDAVLAGDPVAAERVVRDAMQSLTIAEVDDGVLAPALHRVGDLWAAGEISIADEHLATEITLRILALQREAVRMAARRIRRRVLLAALPGELHVIGLRMAAELLETAGYEVRLLGADVPVRALGLAVLRHRPDVVALTATMPAGPRLEEAVEEIRLGHPPAAVMLGGAGVAPAMAERRGLTVCDAVADAVDTADALVQRAALN